MSGSLTVDGTLVMRSQAGDEEAIAELAGQVRPAVQRYAGRFVDDPARAEDLAQTVLMKAFARVGDVRTPEAFPAWLLRITRNECLNELSRLRAATVPLSTLEERGIDLEAPAGGDDDPEETLVRAQLQDAVRRVIAGLPEHYRLTLTMRALEDRTYDEVSAALGVPVTVARLWYCRARKRFRTAFIEAIIERRSLPDGCRALAADIAELIEGTLARPARDTLQGHLTECAVCRQTEEELRTTAFRTPARGLLFALGVAAVPGRLLRSALGPLRHTLRPPGGATLVPALGTSVAGVALVIGGVAGLGGHAIPTRAGLGAPAVAAAGDPAGAGGEGAGLDVAASPADASAPGASTGSDAETTMETGSRIDGVLLVDVHLLDETAPTVTTLLAGASHGAAALTGTLHHLVHHATTVAGALLPAAPALPAPSAGATSQPSASASPSPSATPSPSPSPAPSSAPAPTAPAPGAPAVP